MNIFLAGPPGPDQVATKWLLQQRGYSTVVAECDILDKNYPYNLGMRPSPADYRRLRTLELAQAGLVVLQEGLSAAEKAQMMAIARYAGVPVVEYAELPTQAPDILREDEVLTSLAMPAQGGAGLLARARRFADWFDRRWGWLFINGNKQPRPRPYRLHTIKPTHTA